MIDGTTCKKCGSRTSKVIDSRYYELYGMRVRRRECLNCGARWITAEVYYWDMKGMENDN